MQNNVVLKVNSYNFLEIIIKKWKKYSCLIKGSINEYKRQASILGLNINKTGIERRARFIVSQDYHNAHFFDRVWRDTKELSRRIERNIESVVIQGKNPRELAKKLRDLVS